jgi:hypothetical protein
MPAEDEPARPRLIHIPTQGEWFYLDEITSGDILRLALSGRAERSGDWVQVNLALVAHGASWDPLHYATQWHRADFGADLLEKEIQRLRTADPAGILGEIVHARAHELFAILNDSVYADGEWWHTPAQRLRINPDALESWKEKVQDLSRALRVLGYWGDVPFTYVVCLPDRDRVLFRDSTTDAIHEVELPPGEFARLAEGFARQLRTVWALSSPHT